MLQSTEWMSEGACQTLDHHPDAFFPETVEDARLAMAVCAGCPVAVECRGYAEERGVKSGVWGGEWLRPSAAKNARRRARRVELKAA